MALDFDIDSFTADLDNIIGGDDPPKKKVKAPPVDPLRVQGILERMRGGTSSQESEGNTGAVNPDSGATGEFQVMPDNIPNWTQKYLKRKLTVGQFKNDPQAQRIVFDGEMGSYLNRALRKTKGDEDTAIRMAAAAWYGGQGAMNRFDDPTPQYYKGDRSKKYPSFREYTSKVLSRSKGQSATNPFNDFLKGIDAIVPAKTEVQNFQSGLDSATADPLSDFTKGLDEIIPTHAVSGIPSTAVPGNVYTDTPPTAAEIMAQPPRDTRTMQPVTPQTPGMPPIVAQKATEISDTVKELAGRVQTLGGHEGWQNEPSPDMRSLSIAEAERLAPDQGPAMPQMAQTQSNDEAYNDYLAYASSQKIKPMARTDFDAKIGAADKEDFSAQASQYAIKPTVPPTLLQATQRRTQQQQPGLGRQEARKAKPEMTAGPILTFRPKVSMKGKGNARDEMFAEVADYIAAKLDIDRQTAIDAMVEEALWKGGQITEQEAEYFRKKGIVPSWSLRPDTVEKLQKRSRVKEILETGHPNEIAAEKEIEKEIRKPGWIGQAVVSNLMEKTLSFDREGWGRAVSHFNQWLTGTSDAPPPEGFIEEQKQKQKETFGSYRGAVEANAAYKEMGNLETVARVASQTGRSFVKNLFSGTFKTAALLSNLGSQVTGVDGVREFGNALDFAVRLMAGEKFVDAIAKRQGNDTDLSNQHLFKAALEFDKAVGNDEKLKGRFLGDLSNAGGSAFSFVALGAVMPALSLGKIPLHLGISGALQSGGTGYEEGKRSGLSETDAKKFGVIQMLLGVSEMLGAGGAMVQGIKKQTIRRQLAEGILQAAKREAKQEFGQEVFQTTSGKIALEYLKDKEPETYKKVLNTLNRLPKQFADTVTNEGLIAIITGGAMGAASSAAQRLNVEPEAPPAALAVTDRPIIPPMSGDDQTADSVDAEYSDDTEVPQSTAPVAPVKGVSTPPTPPTSGTAVAPQGERPIVAPPTPRPEVSPERQAEAAQASGLATQQISPEQQRRDAGRFEKDGVEYVRQEPLPDETKGNELELRFADKEPPVKGKWAVVDDKFVQPAHLEGQPNLNTFIPDAQPNRRTDDVSKQSSDVIAQNYDIARDVDSSNPYFGPPAINIRGEVIQGNKRSDAIRKRPKEVVEKNRQWLLENADRFGLNSRQIQRLERPALVRVIDAKDEDAIRLGQYEASDLESGGRKSFADAGRIGTAIPHKDKGSILSDVFLNAGENSTLTSLIRENASTIANRMKPYLSPDEYQTLFGSGTLSPKAVENIKEVFTGFLFSNGSVDLPQVFEGLPHAAQKGLKQSLPAIFNVPENATLVPEIQNAIKAAVDYTESGLDTFDNWANQGDMFTGGLTPNEIFTPVEIELAKKFLTAKRQNDIKFVLTDYAILVSGKEADLFAEKQPQMSKADAVKEVFNVEHRERELPTRSSAEPTEKDDAAGGAGLDTRTDRATRTEAKDTVRQQAAAEAEPAEPARPERTEVEPVTRRPVLHGQPPNELDAPMRTRILYSKERGMTVSDIAQRFNVTPKQVEAARELPRVGESGQMSHRLIQASVPAKQATDAEIAEKTAFVNDLAAELDLPVRLERGSPTESHKNASDTIRKTIAEEMGRKRGSQLTQEDWLKWLDTHGERLDIDTVETMLDALGYQTEHTEKVKSFFSDKDFQQKIDKINRTVGLKNLRSFKDIPNRDERNAILSLAKQYGLRTHATITAFNNQIPRFVEERDVEAGATAKSTPDSATGPAEAIAERPRRSEELAPVSIVDIADEVGIDSSRVRANIDRYGIDGKKVTQSNPFESPADRALNEAISDIALGKSEEPDEIPFAKTKGLKNLPEMPLFAARLTEQTDLAERKQALQNQKPIAITERRTDRQQLFIEARQKFKDLKIFNESFGREVTITGRGLKHIKGTSADIRKAQALPQTDNLLVNGVYLGSEPNRDNDPNVRQYHRLATRAEINGQSVIVESVIRETPLGELLYDFGLTEIVKPTGISDDETLASSLRPTAGSTPSNLLQAVLNVNKNDTSDSPSILFTQTDLFGNEFDLPVEQMTLFNVEQSKADQKQARDTKLEEIVGDTTATYLRSLENSPDKTVRKAAEQIIDKAKYADSAEAKQVIEEAADGLDLYARSIATRTPLDNIFRQNWIDVDVKVSEGAKEFARAIKGNGPGKALNNSLSEANRINPMFMTAWHGSPHRFDKFDSSKIGTGEGAQAYGYGLYFTDKESIAQHYKDVLTKRTIPNSLTEYVEAIRVGDKKASDYKISFDRAIADAASERDAKKVLTLSYYELAKWEGLTKNGAYPYKDYAEEQVEHYRQFIEDVEKDGIYLATSGAKYKVELKPEADEYLLWDKPLSEQSEKVKAILLDKGVVPQKANITVHNDFDRIMANVHKGDKIYRRLADEMGTEANASEYLKSLGIRGIKYLDGSSRGKGEGNYNYVLFDAADIEITETHFSKATEARMHRHILRETGGKAQSQLLQAAKFTKNPENGLVEMNEPALTVLTAAFEGLEMTTRGNRFLGAALDPHTLEVFMNHWDEMLAGARVIGTAPDVRNMERLQKDIRRFTDPVHKDIAFAYAHPAFSKVTKTTAQEELGHIADIRTDVNETEPFENAVGYQEARTYLIEKKHYSERMVHKEILGKLQRDDAADALGISEKQVRELRIIRRKQLFDAQMTAQQYLDRYGNISDANKEQALEYAKLTQRPRATEYESKERGDNDIEFSRSREVREVRDSGNRRGDLPKRPRSVRSDLRRAELLSASRSGDEQVDAGRSEQAAGSNDLRTGTLQRNEATDRTAAQVVQLSYQEKRYIEVKTRKNPELQKAVESEVLFSKTADDPKHKWTVGGVLIDLASAPKSIKTAIDLSGFRQAGILAIANPKIGARAFVKQLHSAIPFHGANFFKEFKRDLDLHPIIELAEDSDLYLSSLRDQHNLVNREEAFMSRLFAEDQVFVNRHLEQLRRFISTPIRLSERAYVTMLDAVRIESFAKLAQELHNSNVRQGREDSIEQCQTLAKAINYMTGRGGLGPIDESFAPIVNATIFSARYWTSRLQILNPFFYAKLPPGTRGIVMKQMAKFVGAVGVFAGLMYLAGADVEWDDPDNPNALKIKLGPWAYDIGFGLVQHLRYIAQMVKATQKQTPTEKSERMKYLTERYLRSKLSPTAGGAVSALSGTNYIGEPTSWTEEGLNLLVPISVENFSEAAKAEGLPGFVKMTPEFFGISTTRYKDSKEIEGYIKKESKAASKATTPAAKIEGVRRVKAWQKLLVRARKYEALDRKKVLVGRENLW